MNLYDSSNYSSAIGIDILLVEDNPRDAEMTVWALQKRNLANQLLVLEDGADALDYLLRRGAYTERHKQNTPKVILLDLKLPKVSGLEVLAELRANEETQHIPVVIVTSSAEDPDVQRAYGLGANSYVVKPVDFNAFVETMSQLGFYWLLINYSSP